MKIKDVSQQTGLSKKTIRFYEAQGLLSPEKSCQNGREYRTYSEENIQQLFDIATLRRARFSVDEIRRIQTCPEEIPTIFTTYRDRLRTEQKQLDRILSVADTIDSESLTSAQELIDRMEHVSVEFPLPKVDIHPRFRYLDELEEVYSMKKKKQSMTKEEKLQHKIAAKNAAMYAAFSVQNDPSNDLAAGGNGGSYDISTTQKIAAYNLLINTKDD